MSTRRHAKARLVTQAGASVSALGLAVLCQLAPTPALSAPGPSFDCAKAASAVEKTICASSDLSAKDLKLAATYRAALDRAAEAGKADLRTGQRQWLAFVRLVCMDKNSFDTPAGCLLQKYDDRQKQLETAVVSMGGLSFHRVDQFSTRPSTPDHDSDVQKYSFGTVEASYPVWDSGGSASRSEFNKTVHARVAEFLKDADGDTDYALDYSILNASPRLISINVNPWSYPHGAAHGQPTTENLHWLVKEGRPLEAKDVFDKAKTWKTFLIDYCFQALSKGEDSFVKTKSGLGDAPVSPKRWTFTKDALVITFDPYEVAPYAAGEPDVEIPWALLKPYLVADPAIR